MNDLRLAFYRQRAEEEGAEVRWWVSNTWLWEREEYTAKHAREAAHYGNLVLGPDYFCSVCGDELCMRWHGKPSGGSAQEPSEP